MRQRSPIFVSSLWHNMKVGTHVSLGTEGLLGSGKRFNAHAFGNVEREA